MTWAEALVEQADVWGGFDETASHRVFRRGLRGHEASRVVTLELHEMAGRVERWAGEDTERRRAAESAVAMGGWAALEKLVKENAP